MANEKITLQVPDVLGEPPQSVEAFYSCLAALPSAQQYTLDMSRVAFVRPYGIIALMSAARLLHASSGNPVRIVNLAGDPLPYLYRMDLFSVGSTWLEASQRPESEWSRDPRTSNLLELTPITGAPDVEHVVGRAERILATWLQLRNLGDLLRVLSELCTNIYEHSGDTHGFVVMQKYESQTTSQIIVRLAVGDLGMGIRQSLSARHPQIGKVPSDFILAALDGVSARTSGRGGLGLRTVESVATGTGGSLWLRSDTGAVMSYSTEDRRTSQQLSPVNGLQILVEWRARL